MRVLIGSVAIDAEFADDLSLVRKSAGKNHVDRLAMPAHPLRKCEAVIVARQLRVRQHNLDGHASQEDGTRLCAADDFDYCVAARAQMLCKREANNYVRFDEENIQARC